ncbi:hypothetical protein WI26_18260 [Burkholderia diffusa]|nr:hypothetical protein WI26_18260 [Burkholderia diffusa]
MHVEHERVLAAGGVIRMRPTTGFDHFHASFGGIDAATVALDHPKHAGTAPAPIPPCIARRASQASRKRVSMQTPHEARPLRRVFKEWTCPCPLPAAPTSRNASSRPSGCRSV